ncbi:MAG: hypothetical protein FWF84_05445 [Kiritimatiellaeota bacterium]|nr:hypothetical protein [Kiritimatiellota bacterium]
MAGGSASNVVFSDRFANPELQVVKAESWTVWAIIAILATVATLATLALVYLDFAALPN